MPSPDLCTEDEIKHLVHEFYARVRADDTLGPIFGQTTATLANAAMRERANELAQRIAESLWYGYQVSRRGQALPEAL